MRPTPRPCPDPGQLAQKLLLHRSGIDLLAQYKAVRLQERLHVRYARAMRVALVPLTFGELCRAVAALIALIERARHVVEHDAARCLAQRGDTREHRIHGALGQVIRHALPQKQASYGACVEPV
jgi:chromosomal replication initiation ATPase DnaA